MMISSNMDFAFERLVTVLVIACPHALGLAIPLVTTRSTSIGATNGLIVKNRESLETFRQLDVDMMDKTSLLTEGNFAVNHFESFNDAYVDAMASTLQSSPIMGRHITRAGITDLCQGASPLYGRY